MNRIVFAFCLFGLMTFSFIDCRAQADELVQVADEMYRFGDIKDALEVYKQALTINPNHVRANLMAGKCYLESIFKERSLPYLLKAYELNPSVTEDILFLIGTSYHLGYDFENGLKYYKKYEDYVNAEQKKFTKDQKGAELQKVNRRLFECNNGKDLVKRPLKVEIFNLGPTVNSEYADYAPVISSDETKMFFTSKRRGSTGGNKDRDNEYFEDIYFTEKKNGKWTTPINMGKPINTNLHESCVGIGQDGKTLFLYIDNDTYKSDILVSKLDKNGKWTQPVSISDNINTKHIESSATISPDGKTLFFSSNRPGGQGGLDLYISHLTKSGEWGKPTNLGELINTEFDEDGPFMDVDGKTLYFSSKGHKGMGGFDLYKSVYDSTSQEWSAPENLGYPINSTDDDVYFMLSGDGKYAYFASVKAEGMGDMDLYKMSMPDENQEQVKEEPIVKKVEKKEQKLFPVKLNLIIEDKSNAKPLEASIEIRDNTAGLVLENGISKGGKYNLNHGFEQEKEVIVSVEMPGYIFTNVKVSIPAAKPIASSIVRKIALDPIAVNKNTVLRNIYFDFDKASLKRESDMELNKLKKFLNDNSSLVIRIEGHTDNWGSDSYNLVLSQKRAEAVVNWLVRNGISRDRLSAKGYGESRPLASNDDEKEGRELNRRTEFTIVTSGLSAN